jgi:outer membrane protein G
MKRILIVLCLLLCAQISNAQAFKGKGDKKFQVGFNAQDGGTGITTTLDFGLGLNMSYGFVGTYLLNTDEIAGESADFDDRADFKFRFNANIGSVLGLSPKADFYPGLHLGTRNFGAHLGFRYFFSEGFGLYTEGSTPLARYDSDVVGFEHLNNQFTFNIGASFNF